MSSVTLIGAQIKKSEARDVKPPEIRGSVIYSDKIEGTNTKAHATGMYSISPEGEFSLLLTKVESNGGGLLLDGLYIPPANPRRVKCLWKDQASTCLRSDRVSA